MGRLYRPCAASLWESLVVSLSPALLGGALLLLFAERAGWRATVPAVLSFALSLNCLLATILAHIRSVAIADEGILILVARRPVAGAPWEGILGGTLRERKNIVTRDDRLLLLKLASGEVLSYCTSVLAKDEEAQLLGEIERHVPLTRVSDKPCF